MPSSELRVTAWRAKWIASEDEIEIAVVLSNGGHCYLALDPTAARQLASDILTAWRER